MEIITAKLLDDVLRYIANSDKPDMDKMLKDLSISKELLENSLIILKDDGYVGFTPTDNGFLGIYISGKGRKFIDFNSYANLERKEKKKWHETYPIVYDLLKGLITAIFTIIVGLLLWTIQSRKKDQQYQEIKRQVRDLKEKVDSLTSSGMYQ